MNKELKDQLTTTLNMLLFSLASCSVLYLGMKLVLADYDIP